MVLCEVMKRRRARTRGMVKALAGTARLGCAVVLVSMAMPIVGWAQNPSLPPASPEQPGSVVPEGETLDWLSRDRYSRRQQATLQMWRDREQSRELVQEAARHSDPEVASRARWVLRQWRRGALPNTPPEVARLLQAADGPEAIERLLEGGQFQAAVVAVEESAGTADREAIQTRISDALTRRFPIYVRLATERDGLIDLLRLVELVAESKEMAVCRIELMQYLGIEINESNLLPDSASLWTQRQRHRAEVLLWMLLGEPERSLAIASDSLDKDLLHQCRMALGKWQDIASDTVPMAREAGPGAYEHARLWTLTMMAAERAGDAELRAEAVEALSTMAAIDSDEGKLAAELRWKCLAVHGEVDAALKIVAAVDPVAASVVASDASRSDVAFDALGFPREKVDAELEQWIDQALEAQSKSKEPRVTQEVNQLMALMRCLSKIGRSDAAWRIAKRLAYARVNIDDLALREYVLFELLKTRRSDWVVELSIGPASRNLSAPGHAAISQTLPDCDATTFEIVLQGVSSLMRGASLIGRVKAAEQLVRGEVPATFDPETDFERLYEFVVAPQQRQRLGRGNIRPKAIIANLDIVRLFLRHDQTEYAMQCLNRLAEDGNAEAIFFLAERELDGGRADEAEELFTRVYEIVASQNRVSGRFLGADDVALAVKARIGHWVIARRNGEDQRADAIEREIRLCLGSPSTRLRAATAEYLSDRGEDEMALESYETVMMMTLFGNDEQSSLFNVARFYSPLAHETQLGDASRWFDLAVAGSLDQIGFRSGAYVTLPLICERWSMEDAIRARDGEAVARHIDRILMLDPLDIDFAERLLPELRGTELESLAQQTLERVMRLGQQYSARFPMDAMTSNNLAWVAAMNNRHLDEALELARKAVFIEPDSAIYRDTLAEVLFLLGRQDEALLVEKACLLDDPTQWHLHEQIEKYANAIENP